MNKDTVTFAIVSLARSMMFSCCDGSNVATNGLSTLQIY
jgi:hypothetical protein